MIPFSSQGCTAGAPVARNGSRTCDPKVSEIFADTSRNGGGAGYSNVMWISWTHLYKRYRHHIIPVRHLAGF